MIKFLIGYVILFGGAFYLGSQNAPQGTGIIEATGFRMIRDGKTVWEVVPSDNGRVQMTFSPGGKEVCKVWCSEKAVSCRCEVGGTTSEVVIADGVYSNGVVVDDSKITMLRVITKPQVDQNQTYTCADVIRMGNNEVEARVTPTMARSSITSDTCKAAFELTRGPKSGRGDLAVLSANVPDDVKLNVRVGEGKQAMTCLGDLIGGFVIELANRYGGWSWANKK